MAAAAGGIRFLAFGLFLSGDQYLFLAMLGAFGLSLAILWGAMRR